MKINNLFCYKAIINKLSLKSQFFIMLLILLTIQLIYPSIANAVQFKELNETFQTNCLGCKYYSILYDVISKGGYKIYTGLFNISLFLLAIGFSFFILKHVYETTVIISPDGNKIGNLNSFWKTLITKIIRIIAVITTVLLINPQTVIKYTIDPIMSGGIALSRLFINKGATELKNRFYINNSPIQSQKEQTLQIGILKLNIFPFNPKLEQPDYCKSKNRPTRKRDAERYEQIDNSKNQPNALLTETKLDFLCLLKEVNMLSERYAGLASYYTIKTLNPTQLKDKAEVKTKDLLSNNDASKTIEIAITIGLAIWLVFWWLSIKGIISLIIPDPTISFTVSLIPPALLVILYILFGAYALIIAGVYLAWYFTLIIALPFFYIQPLLKMAMTILVIPLVAVGWALGKTEYMSNILGQFISSAIGLAVLSMMFMICIFINELTVYSLYGDILVYQNLYQANQTITQSINFNSFLIMMFMNILGIFLMSKYATIASLFGGSGETAKFLNMIKSDIIKPLMDKIKKTTRKKIP